MKLDVSHSEPLSMDNISLSMSMDTSNIKDDYLGYLTNLTQRKSITPSYKSRRS